MLKAQSIQVGNIDAILIAINKQKVNKFSICIFSVIKNFYYIIVILFLTSNTENFSIKVHFFIKLANYNMCFNQIL